MRINIEVEKLVELINIVNRIPNLKKVVEIHNSNFYFIIYFFDKNNNTNVYYVSKKDL